MVTSPHQQFSLGDFMSPAALPRQKKKMVQPNTVTGVWFCSWPHEPCGCSLHPFPGHGLQLRSQLDSRPTKGRKTSPVCVLLCTGQHKSQRSHRGERKIAAPISASEGFGPWPLLALSGKLKSQSGKEQEGFALCYYLPCQQQPKQISRCPNS